MLNTLTLKQALDKLTSNEISLDDLYSDLDAAIAKDNTELNVYLHLNKQAKTQASSAATSPLRGVPLAIKDNISTAGVETTASSKVLDGYTPVVDATITTKLKAAGGVVHGKTNLDAWAHGSSTETSGYGATHNPRNPDHLPGGSSGGSAAAVAGDMAIASIGTETAGSIRQPAAWCGVVGLKPTYGRVSRYGIVAMASSTDSPGPITKTVEDSAILLNHMAGKDIYDATTSDQSTPDFTTALGKSLKGLKIGVVYHDLEGLADAWSFVEPQLAVFRDLGAEVEMVAALDPRHAVSVYTIVQRAEVSSNLARYTGIRYGNTRDHFGDEAKRRIMLGTFALSKGYADKYYTLAQKVRRLYMDDFDTQFSKYDALISLTSPSFAKKLGATEGEVMFGELEDLLLEPSSLAGLPGISVPCYRDQKTNLFLGLNIMAPKWREDTCLTIADAFEKNTDWNTWRSNE